MMREKIEAVLSEIAKVGAADTQEAAAELVARVVDRTIIECLMVAEDVSSEGSGSAAVALRSQSADIALRALNYVFDELKVRQAGEDDS